MKQKLTIDILIKEAKAFYEAESRFENEDVEGIIPIVRKSGKR